ncbi:MAG: hypothetical protein BHV78_04640 [Bacteroides sp. CAG:1060_57_27]|nr:MAG: hypothetical protein BHV78_04640 [Bacteroides sp. CAG:1060_57_27]
MDYTRCKLISAIILMAAGQVCGAQESPDPACVRMSLRDCMEYALDASTKMRISEADRDDEQAARRQAIFEAFTPSVSASTYASNSYGRNIDPETNIYNTVTSFYNGYSLSGSIVLFDGFRAVNNLKVANTAMKMGLSAEQRTRDEICLATMEAFYNVLYYTELEKVLREQVETAEQSLLKAAREEELGQKGHAEVVQMESDLAKRRYDLINTSNMRSDAMITLKDVMFYPVDGALELEAPADAAAAPSASALQARELARRAVETLPQAVEARLSLENASTELRAARWAYSPTLSLSAGWSSSYYDYPGMADYTALPFAEQLSVNGGEYIQLSLSIPIFDRLSRRSNIARRKNAYARAGAQYDQTVKDIENEVYRAVSDRDGAMAAYLQAERLSEAQQEAYRLDTRRFEQGLISSIEYRTSSESYLNAQAERLGAKFKYMIKDSVVRYYGGTPYLEQY